MHSTMTMGVGGTDPSVIGIMHFIYIIQPHVCTPAAIFLFFPWLIVFRIILLVLDKNNGHHTSRAPSCPQIKKL